MLYDTLSGLQKIGLRHSMAEHTTKLLLLKPTGLADISKCRFLLHGKGFDNGVVYDDVQAEKIVLPGCDTQWANCKP